MERNTFSENDFLYKINSVINQLYTKFDEILSLNENYTCSNIGASFKKRIYEAKGNIKQMELINIAYEYFVSNSNYISIYNQSDKSNLIKYSKFKNVIIYILILGYENKKQNHFIQ